MVDILPYKTTDFVVGESIIYPLPCGDIPGTVIKITPRRVIIELKFWDRASPRRRAVHPKSLIKVFTV
jgi:hypothetical protein